MSKAKKVEVTTNYRLFYRSVDNRPTDIKKHGKLVASMKKYGFLSCFPIVCFRNSKGQLIVKDGQHRLMIAEDLGLPVYWIEEEVDFDIAEINCAGRGWVLRDYALKFAAAGVSAYKEALEFAEQHGLPIGTTFAILAGTTSFSNVAPAFMSGEFRVKDKAWASSVAELYMPLTALSKAARNSRCLEACMAVCRVEGFDKKRLLHAAERCRDKLVSYSTKDAYLDVLEAIYNHCAKKLFPLKIGAMAAMRERNVASRVKSPSKTDAA